MIIVGNDVRLVSYIVSFKSPCDLVSTWNVAKLSVFYDRKRTAKSEVAMLAGGAKACNM